ncbi:MAG: response regulator [Bacillota bacterium]
MAKATTFEKTTELLLVEDNPGDVRLIKEALKETRLQINLHVAKDGTEAMAFLRREGKYANAPRVDLILLDLNLPGKDGREILAEIKGDERLRRTPVIVLTTSEAKEDVVKIYELNANCYITKPLNLDEFIKAIKMIGEFWFTVVTLPPR